ncbi:hypothetical protein [Luteolibacter marinus]|uniref:hypothetical protein n=1 Tax=Luteolibacter marinus TaxID=2776705 RepID=UPI0018669D69|nr:hypothetical protein [Luteolibacter marinus]
MRFAGLIIGLILVAISWGAIQRRVLYWIGVVISVGILFKIGDIPSGFQLRPDLHAKLMYGGVTVPMILGAIMFVTHLFVSGRLNE